jgi:predicted polyphosphate/ATP-dependent NAD kinase
MFKLGLVVNPWAGIGGPLALKGSDGAAVVAQAQASGAEQRSSARATVALDMIDKNQPLTVYCFAGDMGEDAVLAAGLSVEVVGIASVAPSCAEDSLRAAVLLKEMSVDLLIFVGGDGTARDIYRAIGHDFPVLGIPAGVKMHSAVYAVSPQAAGELINRLISAQLVDVGLAEVRDIDEQAFRQGQVRSRFFGELLVPREGHFLQQVKSSGREVEELVVDGIAADIIESMTPATLYIIGPGSTPRAIMQQLGLANTLLGFDALKNNKLCGTDLDERGILALLAEHGAEPASVKIIITAIGGQGHILGRGNQQLSPAVLRVVGLDSLQIIATKTKITELQGRPLLVDSNDPELDAALSGYRQVITGYHDAIMYPVGFSFADNKA